MQSKITFTKILLAVLCQILSASPNAQTTSPPAVAILDFEAKGLPVYEVETLTERLRSEAANTEAIHLIDRKMLETILQEQGLQQSGCTTDECAAEVGELLGAQFMISGSIGKLGDSYTIDAKMVSVTTGAAVRAKTVTYEGEVSGLILEMEILAWEIVGLSAPSRLLLKRIAGKAEDKMTVAILDFDPRGISILEAQTLTDRFATEINNTGMALLVDRRAMTEIMEEQGFQSAECTSEECAAEVGALLGVQFMINGAIGKLGKTYTIDAKMFEVATGAAARTKNTTYTGEVDGLITEIEILAWEMMGLNPPRDLLNSRRGVVAGAKAKTRFGAVIRSTVLPGWGQLYSGRKLTGWTFLGGELVLGALAFISYSTYQTAYDDATNFHQQYESATDPAQIQNFKVQTQEALDDVVAANDQLTTMLYAAGGLWAINVVHALLTGPKENMAAKKTRFDFVYHPEMRQPQLRLSLALDSKTFEGMR